MFDTLLLRPSLHCSTPLPFTTLHPTTHHYTYRHFTSSHLHFITLSFSFTHLHFISFRILLWCTDPCTLKTTHLITGKSLQNKGSPCSLVVEM